jgi:hypothetical protein
MTEATRVSRTTPRLCDEWLDGIKRFSGTREFADDMRVVGRDITPLDLHHMP